MCTTIVNCQHLSALFGKHYRNKAECKPRVLKEGDCFLQESKDNMQNTQKAEVIFTVPAESGVFPESSQSIRKMFAPFPRCWYRENIVVKEVGLVMVRYFLAQNMNG